MKKVILILLSFFVLVFFVFIYLNTTKKSPTHTNKAIRSNKVIQSNTEIQTNYTPSSNGPKQLLKNHSFKTIENIIKIEYESINREILIDLPKNYNSNKKYPLLLGFHGKGGSYNSYYLLFKSLVKKGAFIGVYPQGVDNAWNSAINYDINDKANDVGFVSELIDYIIENYNIDSQKIYAVGNSNGGEMG